MPAPSVALTISGLYLSVCLVLGLWPRRQTSDSAEGYVAGDRDFGLVLTYFITGATIFSAFAFLGAPGRVYSQGAAAYYILGYGGIGLVPLYFLGPRASRVGRVYGFVTQAEMVSFRYQDRRLAGVMSIVSVTAFICYLALQMKGAGYVLEVTSGGLIPAWVGALIVYTIVAIYVLQSGVLGVGWTNVFQGVFMMVLAWGLGLYLPYLLHGGVQPMFEKLAAADPQHLLPPGGDGRGGRWTWTAYSSAVLVSMLGFSMWPHTFMRAFSARSEQTLRWSIVLFPTFQAFLVPLFLIGFAGIGFSPAPDRPDQILPHLLVHLELPAVVGGLFCAGALAASMSTGDALAHAAGAVTVRDGLVGAAGFSFSPTMERRLMRLVVVAVLVTAYVAAMVYQGSLVNLLLMSFGAVVQFTPGVALALYDRRGSGTAVFGGLVAGAVVTGVLTLWPSLRFTDLHPGLIGLFVNVGVLALLRQVVPASAPDRAEAFIDVAQHRFRKPAPTATASLAESRRPVA